MCYQILRMIWTHPSTHWHANERGIQAVQVKNERTIITSQHGGYTATPVQIVQKCIEHF